MYSQKDETQEMNTQGVEGVQTQVPKSEQQHMYRHPYFQSYRISGENNTSQKEVTRGQKSPVSTYAGTEANSVPPTTERPEGVGTQTHGWTKL